ncbi:unnamed protein product [Mytilus coruscus]|uniref:Uncharacterized protein n=1 Tax=Mytilus coruscus TaxID=42192 RepID=A0A6J8DQ12_MYTCO|nr:unnamed protein product [Mytilus coruscus]
MVFCPSWKNFLRKEKSKGNNWKICYPKFHKGNKRKIDYDSCDSWSNKQSKFAGTSTYYFNNYKKPSINRQSTINSSNKSLLRGGFGNKDIRKTKMPRHQTVVQVPGVLFVSPINSQAESEIQVILFQNEDKITVGGRLRFFLKNWKKDNKRPMGFVCNRKSLTVDLSSDLSGQKSRKTTDSKEKKDKGKQLEDLLPGFHKGNKRKLNYCRLQVYAFHNV